MNAPDDLGQWLEVIFATADDKSAAIHSVYQQLDNAGLLNKVTVHKFLCERRGCVLATVIRVNGMTIARTKDNKLSPGTNLDRSVETARIKNTIDGDRHWPGHTFHIEDLAAWGDSAGMDMSCRHALRTVKAAEVLLACADATPGHPTKPSRI